MIVPALGVLLFAWRPAYAMDALLVLWLLLGVAAWFRLRRWRAAGPRRIVIPLRLTAAEADALVAEIHAASRGQRRGRAR